MTTILMLAFIAYAVYCVLSLRRIQKHDRVLFPLCRLRRDIMAFLRKHVFANPGALSQQDYTAVRLLLDALNFAIDNYNEHKTSMFNMRKMARHIKAYRYASKPVRKIPEQPEIAEFQRCFRRLLAVAFIAYTPLIRWQIALLVIAAASRVGYREGKKTRARRDAEYVVKNSAQVRDDARRYGLIAGAAATA